MSTPDHFDICIIGAGVIGLATAWRLTSLPGSGQCSVVLLEQHEHFGQETSSRNSEVIHAGIYYPTGSLKARCCVRGKELLYDFCRRHNVPYRQTGKLIVAGKGQEGQLESIDKQARANGVDDLERLDRAQVLALEPELLSASAALFSPSSGILDSHQYMQSLLHQGEIAGLVYSPLTRVTAIHPSGPGYEIESLCQDTAYRFTCSQVVNAGGLWAQEIAKNIEGFPPGHIPQQSLVKGSYFTLQGKAPFSHLVYPVPEIHLKGLGIHLTLDMAGQARFGPDTEPVEDFDYSVNPGCEDKFREAIAAYFPGIDRFSLVPGYAGIRPKIASNGVADFVIQDGGSVGFEGLVQLFGIESPGLTASLAIADQIVSLLGR